MYLNQFDRETVLSVIEELKADKGLIILVYTTGNDPYLKLMYESLMHRLFVYKFDPNEPLYLSPSVISRLAPKKEFIKEVKKGVNNWDNFQKGVNNPQP